MGEGATWQPVQRKPKAPRVAPEPTAEDLAKAERPRRFWRESVEITAGSLAERYLTETRGIARPVGGWPVALRYHPRRVALVVAATTAAGEVQAVQLVHLTPEGRKREDDNDGPAKQSFGPLVGALVRLPGDGAVLVLAEGPETGLSVWTATGRETWIALGSIAKVEPPALRRLLVLRDDDPRAANSDKASTALRRRTLAQPTTSSRKPR